MQKTIFKIAKMDCASEEQLIRMKLSGLSNIQSLQFDISNRKVTIVHSGPYDQIFQQLNSLNLNTSVVDTLAAGDFVTTENHPTTERKLLWQVLAINFSLFVIELLAGLFANSMGLVADSLDMLADAIVYGLALFAVGGTLSRKKSIAQASGYFQLFLAVLGFIEVLRRFLGFESIPDFRTMIIISILALLANAVCLYLLQKSKSKEVHMQASMIFTSNDVIVNVGVIAAGILVYFTETKYPDLIIGTIVFVIVAQGAFRILKLSK
jgi:Co/Zn/Cd efflux system component